MSNDACASSNAGGFRGLHPLASGAAIRIAPQSRWLSTSCGRRLEPQVLSWIGADVESAIGFHRQTALHPLTPLVNALNF